MVCGDWWGPLGVPHGDGDGETSRTPYDPHLCQKLAQIVISIISI